jgi:hypothetical protein
MRRSCYWSVLNLRTTLNAIVNTTTIIRVSSSLTKVELLYLGAPLAPLLYLHHSPIALAFGFHKLLFVRDWYSDGTTIISNLLSSELLEQKGRRRIIVAEKHLGRLIVQGNPSYWTVFYEFLKCGLYNTYNMYNTFCLIQWTNVKAHDRWAVSANCFRHFGPVREIRFMKLVPHYVLLRTHDGQWCNGRWCRMVPTVD